MNEMICMCENGEDLHMRPIVIAVDVVVSTVRRLLFEQVMVNDLLTHAVNITSKNRMGKNASYVIFS